MTRLGSWRSGANRASFQDLPADEKAVLNRSVQADPDGRSKDLGQELDLVVGAEGIGDLTAELVFGAFFPGDAFGPNADPAYFVSFELQFAF